jgi:CubicO group peptidase (beta-lactamase class C family)
MRLEDRVTRFLPNFGVYGKGTVSLRHLLAHCGGLAAWRPFHRDIVREERQGRPNFVATRGAKEFVYEQIHRERPEYAAGTRSVYSDLGFIVLGELVETLGHMPLDRFCQERIFRPLGLRSMAFVDLSLVRLHRMTPAVDMIAPTERCPWRKRVLCGEVHDDNAYAMGGVAGHAGLFGSAIDVDGLIGRLRACYRGEDSFVPTEIVREFWTRDDTVRDSTWALGWDTPSTAGSSAGRHFGPRSVGHLGFTGTSVWVDLERDVHVILLTNRVHPSRDNERIREIRPRVHDVAMEALGA